MAGFTIHPETGERIYSADSAPLAPEPSRGPPMVIPGGWVVDFLAGPNTQVLPLNSRPRLGHRPPRKSIRRFR